MIKLFEKLAQNITMQQTRREPANGCQSDLEEQIGTEPLGMVALLCCWHRLCNYADCYPKLVTCKIEFCNKVNETRG